MNRHESNPWKGFLIGTVGSVAGLLAMGFYWKTVSSLQNDRKPARKPSRKPARKPEPGLLDDISLIGRQHRKEESSTGAIGRILYTAVTGKEPRSKELKSTLSNMVHWGYGMMAGGLYGALRGESGIRDIVKGGLVFSVGLWMLGDELAVPLLGLQGGPTSVPPEQHARRLGAHLAYGVAAAGTTQLLEWALEEK
jgi:hypothetical protein